MVLSTLLFALYAAQGFASLASSNSDVYGSPSAAVYTVYNSTERLFFESLAVRPNGSILIDTLSQPRVYTLDPTARRPTAYPLFTIDDGVVNGISGIAEIRPDEYAVVAGNWTVAKQIGQNFSIWTFDARRSPVVPKKAASLPPDGLGNGATTLPGFPGVVLTCDSYKGGVWRVDTSSGKVDLVIQDESMKASNASNGTPLGVNGIHVRDGYLYYTNSNKNTFSRMRINRDGTQAGPAELIARAFPNESGYDDFAFDARGNAWIATHPGELNRVAPDGKQVLAAGGVNSTALGTVGPTSAAFGRGAKGQQSIIYLTLGDGAIVAVDTAKLH